MSRRTTTYCKYNINISLLIKSFHGKSTCVIESEIITLCVCTLYTSLSLSLSHWLRSQRNVWPIQPFATKKHAPWDWVWRQSEMPKLNIIHNTRTISNTSNNNTDLTNEHNNLSKQINKYTRCKRLSVAQWDNVAGECLKMHLCGQLNRLDLIARLRYFRNDFYRCQPD